MLRKVVGREKNQKDRSGGGGRRITNSRLGVVVVGNRVRLCLKKKMTGLNQCHFEGYFSDTF
jgi:hypothetical protein